MNQSSKSADLRLGKDNIEKLKEYINNKYISTNSSEFMEVLGLQYIYAEAKLNKDTINSNFGGIKKSGTRENQFFLPEDALKKQ